MLFSGGLFSLGLLPRRAIFQCLDHQCPVFHGSKISDFVNQWESSVGTFPPCNIFVILVSLLACFWGSRFCLPLFSSPPSAAACSQEVLSSGHCLQAVRAGLVVFLQGICLNAAKCSRQDRANGQLVCSSSTYCMQEKQTVTSQTNTE